MIWFLPFLPLLAKAILWGSITIVTIGALSVAIDTIISRPSIEEVMKSQGLKRVLVEEVNRTSNKVKLRDLNNDDVWTISGTDVDYDVQKGVRITI